MRRIIDAPATGTVEIQGRIVSGEEGTVESSFGGKPAVWFRATVEEGLRGRPTVWSSVFTESASRPFYVDDESGETAKVIPGCATIILDENVRDSVGDWHGATPAFEAFLNARGIESTRWFGLRNRVLRIVEEILAPGDHLYALGAARS